MLSLSAGKLHYLICLEALLHSSACEAQLKKLDHAVIVSDLPPHLISQERMGSQVPIEPSPQPIAFRAYAVLHVCGT